MEQERRPYMPSNGTEGMCFEDKFCDKCGREDVDNEKFCDIHTDALIGKQPKEWIYGPEGPLCTAYLDPEGQPNTSIVFKDMPELPFKEAKVD